MQVTTDGKWFWVTPPTEPAPEAAEHILAMRMDEVLRYLPLAAHHAAEDVEYVHQLRVHCRRASAALRAFEPLASRGARRSSGGCAGCGRLRARRDADVFVTRLQADLDPANANAQQLIDVVVHSRGEAQRALVDADEKASRGGLQRAVDRCRRRIHRAGKAKTVSSFADYAEHAIAAAAQGLEEIDAHAASMVELHELRIAAKRLRYAIEIFHSGAAPELRFDAYPIVEEIQERLGAINDHTTSQLRLQQWIALLPADDLAAFVAGLIVNENAEAERIRDEFLEWWTPERQAQLHQHLQSAWA